MENYAGMSYEEIRSHDTILVDVRPNMVRRIKIIGNNLQHCEEMFRWLNDGMDALMFENPEYSLCVAIEINNAISLEIISRKLMGHSDIHAYDLVDITSETEETK